MNICIKFLEADEELRSDIKMLQEITSKFNNNNQKVIDLNNYSAQGSDERELLIDSNDSCDHSDEIALEIPKIKQANKQTIQQMNFVRDSQKQKSQILESVPSPINTTWSPEIPYNPMEMITNEFVEKV